MKIFKRSYAVFFAVLVCITMLSINPKVSQAATPESPMITYCTGFAVNQGSAKIIDNTIISATDADTDDSTIVYIITQAPHNGVVQETSQNLNESTSWFTEGDLDNSKIRYVHDGSATTTDSFKVKAHDIYGNETDEITLNITIQEDNEAPIIVTNNKISVDNNRYKIISDQDLFASDVDTYNDSIIFTVASPPSSGRFELDTNPGVAINEFSQQDIIDGYVKYVHNGNDATTDTCTINVRDGAGNQSSNAIVNIEIILVHMTDVNVFDFHGERNADNSCKVWNVGDMYKLAYSYAPLNASITGASFASNNPSVASVDPRTGMVTAHAVGRATITITLDDKALGIFTDQLTIQVIDNTTTSDSSVKKGTIKGTLVDQDGNPLSGYTITLYSTPIDVVTNSKGEFRFNNVSFDNHTLVVCDSNNVEIGRFILSFTSGNTNAVNIYNQSNELLKTYNDINNTVILPIELRINGGIKIYENMDSAKEYNPQTGSDVENSYMWMVAGFIALTALFAIVVSIKKRNI